MNTIQTYSKKRKKAIIVDNVDKLAGTIIKMPVQANQSTAVTVNLDEPEEVKTDIKNLEESIDKTANKKVLFVMPFSARNFFASPIKSAWVTSALTVFAPLDFR